MNPITKVMLEINQKCLILDLSSQKANKWPKNPQMSKNSNGLVF